MFDTFSTKNTSRDDLRKILDYLDSKSIDYSFNGPEEILELDITELSETAQTFLEKKLSRINEGNIKMKKVQAKQIIENFIRTEVRKALTENKEITIIKTRNGRESEVTGTIDYLIDYFKYTLEKGNSWNKKVVKDPEKLRKMNPQKFVNNLVLAKDSSTGNGYDASTDYDLK